MATHAGVIKIQLRAKSLSTNISRLHHRHLFQKKRNKVINDAPPPGMIHLIDTTDTDRE